MFFTGESEDVWALEDLVIGGSSSDCDIHMMKDSFSIPDGRTDEPANWLFHHGGKLDKFCNSTGGSLLFENDVGEHSVSTNDMCVSENYVIQFKVRYFKTGIKVDCLYMGSVSLVIIS